MSSLKALFCLHVLCLGLLTWLGLLVLWFPPAVAIPYQGFCVDIGRSTVNYTVHLGMPIRKSLARRIACGELATIT